MNTRDPLWNDYVLTGPNTYTRHPSYYVPPELMSPLGIRHPQMGIDFLSPMQSELLALIRDLQKRVDNLENKLKLLDGIDNLEKKVDKLEELVVAGAFAPGGILSTQAELEFNNLLGDYIQNNACEIVKKIVDVEIDKEEEQVYGKIPEKKSKSSKRRSRRRKNMYKKNK